MMIIRRRAIYSLWTLVFALVGEATANNPPQVALLEATSFVDEATTVTYVLYDEDDDTDGSLKYELYAYPDNGLKSVADIRTFALLLADQRDITQEVGTGDFVESTSTEDMQDYTWGDPGGELRALGFAAVNKVLPITMWVYLVADDGANEPVFVVSDFTIAVNRSATAVESRTWGWVKGAMQ